MWEQQTRHPVLSNDLGNAFIFIVYFDQLENFSFLFILNRLKTFYVWSYTWYLNKNIFLLHWYELWHKNLSSFQNLFIHLHDIWTVTLSTLVARYQTQTLSVSFSRTFPQPPFSSRGPFPGRVVLSPRPSPQAGEEVLPSPDIMHGVARDERGQRQGALRAQAEGGQSAVAEWYVGASGRVQRVFMQSKNVGSIFIRFKKLVSTLVIFMLIGVWF